MGDRPGRMVPPQTAMSSEWLPMKASDGEEWTVQARPAPAQADERRDGLMYYIQLVPQEQGAVARPVRLTS